MKYLQPIRFAILLLLASFATLLSGCILNESDDCPGELCRVKVNFVYELNMRYTDEFASVADNVELYVFDNATGNLMESITISRSELAANGYSADLALPQGSYNIVCWANICDSDYERNSVIGQHRSAAYIHTKCRGDGTIDRDFTAIYHGQCDIAATGGSAQATINLIKNTNYVNVHNVFDIVLPPNVQIVSYITGSNGTFDFDNNQASAGPTLKYIPREVITYAGQTNSHYYTLQRMWSGDDLELTVLWKETNQPDKILKQMRITPAIMSNPVYSTDTDLEREDTYNITFTYTGTFMVSEIYINDWQYIEHNTGLSR